MKSITQFRALRAVYQATTGEAPLWYRRARALVTAPESPTGDSATGADPEGESEVLCVHPGHLCRPLGWPAWSADPLVANETGAKREIPGGALCVRGQAHITRPHVPAALDGALWIRSRTRSVAGGSGVGEKLVFQGVTDKIQHRAVGCYDQIRTKLTDLSRRSYREDGALEE